MNRTFHVLEGLAHWAIKVLAEKYMSHGRKKILHCSYRNVIKKHVCQNSYVAPLCVSAAADAQDFCPWENFKAKCAQGEVIIMETAKYGRMKLGRCVKNDLGYVGCYTDVMDVADSMCSGRQECVINTPNPTFDRLKPCLEDLKSYFEAGYWCQPVIAAATDMCRSAANFIKVKASEGYLSNAITKASGCGSANAPWVLEAQPGQRINITLFDFAVMSDQKRTNYLGDTGCLR